MTDTILIVDDEESVRRTFQEWVASSGLGARVFVAADAESALRVANEYPIDLAILDWNLGSGSDGLRLLEDLVEFRPDIVAILVTGFAHQATPLDATTEIVGGVESPTVENPVACVNVPD
jgi:DNA-binding NtrC family response regulator